ncbi:MAG: hypothetical protein E6Q50_02375 [Lysobacter sp.]|nr:MAG: hypothetical protein E6Q50_02375 [Lysobacter sp.]
MKRSPSEKYTLLFEAARRSLYACDLAYKRLLIELSSLEPRIDANIELGQEGIPPLLTAAGFVDFAHRFGSIVDSLPLVNKKSEEIKTLRASLKNVEFARNHLQHMRGDLCSNEPIDYPILGSLSWIGGESCYALCPTQATPVDYVSIAYDNVERRWATTCQYQVKRIEIDIPKVLRQAHLTYAWLVKQTTFADPNEKQLSWGKTSAMVIRLAS